MTFPKTLASIAIATSFLATAPALAASTYVDEKTQDVFILGYDLTDRADAEKVLKKIESAAERVCRISAGPVTLQERRLRENCEEKAVDIAVNSLQSPMLTDVLKASRDS